ncbi:MAG TPA: gluconate 2-dehydrogenase subunit 3 family protein [Flavitalea sp.]|nr:gluconate 2-dehydrogenase subunit 3 family protein [Flavitalea sp.]
MKRQQFNSATLTRRILLKQMLILSAGAAIIPACSEDTPKEGLRFQNFAIDAGELIVLGELTATIIPTTDGPGAREVSADQFMLKMIDDCYSPEQQRKFVSGLKSFEARAGRGTGKSFADLSADQRTKLLTDLEKEKDADTDLSFFYSTAKRLTMEAYTTSKYYLTKVQVYELVPGRYHGCVPFGSVKQKKAS